ncbi:squalene/phytoene synthase family protein, partial [Teichococcus wenyumeiae]
MPDAAPLSELAALARRHDPDRFLCALFAPPKARETLFLLTAFNHELARARAATSNTMTGLIRLQWWRDVVEEAAAGNPPRRHEVAQPLAEAIRAGQLLPEELLPLVDAREAEVEEEMPSRDALLAFLRGSAGGYAVVAGRVLEAPPAAMPHLQAAGAAYGMAGVLRGIGIQAGQGHCLLPSDLLEQHGLTPADVARDPGTPAVATVARALAEETLASLRAARAALRGVLPREALAAALP